MLIFKTILMLPQFDDSMAWYDDMMGSVWFQKWIDFMNEYLCSIKFLYSNLRKMDWILESYKYIQPSPWLDGPKLGWPKT